MTRYGCGVPLAGAAQLATFLLRFPKFVRRTTAASNFDRCHSFCSLHPPPAALANVPVPAYADGCKWLVFRTFLQSASVSKRLFDTLKGCRDFPCTLSLHALRPVTFPKSKKMRASCAAKPHAFWNAPNCKKGMGAAHAAVCRSHAAWRCASRSAARRASALLSRQTGCCRALRKAVPCQQLGMIALFDDVPVLHQPGITSASRTVERRCATMKDVRPAIILAKRGLNFSAPCACRSTGRLVEDQHRRQAEHGARNADQLALSGRGSFSRMTVS